MKKIKLARLPAQAGRGENKKACPPSLRSGVSGRGFIDVVIGLQWGDEGKGKYGVKKVFRC